MKRIFIIVLALVIVLSGCGGKPFILDVSALTDANIGPVDTGDLRLNTGELQGVTYGGNGVVVVKAKIKPMTSNESTILQNYSNVWDLICNHGFDTAKELQYWAVADMTSGDESKVISFTVPERVIKDIAAGKISPDKMADKVDDLWILPSLQK